jgi:hypothetical protein
LGNDKLKSRDLPVKSMEIKAEYNQPLEMKSLKKSGKRPGQDVYLDLLSLDV